MGRVAVEDRGADLRQLQGPHGAQLVAGQRLGGREVQRGAAVVGEQPLEHGQQVGQRLAGGGAGGDDHVTARPRVRHLGLVRPERGHAGQLEARAQQAGQVVGQGHGAGRPGRAAQHVQQPLLAGGVDGVAVVDHVAVGPGGDRPGDDVEHVARVHVTSWSPAVDGTRAAHAASRGRGAGR